MFEILIRHLRRVVSYRAVTDHAMSPESLNDHKRILKRNLPKRSIWRLESCSLFEIQVKHHFGLPGYCSKHPPSYRSPNQVFGYIDKNYSNFLLFDELCEISSCSTCYYSKFEEHSRKSISQGHWLLIW